MDVKRTGIIYGKKNYFAIGIRIDNIFRRLEG